MVVDDYILKYLEENKHEVPQAFKTYIADKRRDELKLKFADKSAKKLHPEYVYLKNRLAAIKAAVKYFLGAKELKRIEKLFEAEYTRRILEAREH